MPRQTKRTDAIVSDILQRLSAGEPLAKICRDPIMPHPSTWADWCNTDETLSIAHGRARDDGFDAISADILDIIDAEPEMAISADGSSRRDSAYVAWQKARVETRLKLLAKWDPKRYGELLKHGNADGSNIDLASGIEAARQRAASA